MFKPLIALSEFLEALLYFFSGVVLPDKDTGRKPTIGHKLLPLKYKSNTRLVLLANIVFWLAVLLLLVFWVAVMSR